MTTLAELPLRLFDARYLGRLRALLDAAAPTTPPAARLLAPDPAPSLERLGVFSGSFNPLTHAHCAVVEAAHRWGHFDLVAYTLSTLTTDKEAVTGITLDDRLAVLLAHTHGRPGEGVLLVNRGLYVEQARALRAAFPALRELWLVVGFDKIVQVFDPRYYADREAALDELFSLAGFLVAPRGGAGAGELAMLLDQPGNRRFRDRVQLLEVADGHADASSTQARAQAELGEVAPGALPDAAATLIRATGAYRAPVGGSPSPYQLRRALLEEAWAAAPVSAAPEDLARRWAAVFQS